MRRNGTEQKSFMEKVSAFIVNKRIVFYILFLALVVGSVICIPRVKVNYDITSYLPEHSETRQALDIMSKEFETNGSAEVMVSGVSVEEALQIKELLAGIPGVKNVDFQNNDSYYKETKALFKITMVDQNSDKSTMAAVEQIKTTLAKYDAAFSGGSVSSADMPKNMAKEMAVILGIAAAVILIVLLFTSKSYIELLLFFIVFAVAAVINMGTNFFFKNISFISNSIAVVLQLALAIDYAIIFLHRYAEEHVTKNVKDAAISALTKSIPAILSSSLTTVSGLVALMFMQFRIGFDIGIILAKGIVISFLTVFLLMPGLIMLFSKWIDKTQHRTFVPKMTFLGKFSVKTRKVAPILALALIVAACGIQTQSTYIFSESSYPTAKNTQYTKDTAAINEVFGKSNLLAVIVPKGDYESERKVYNAVLAHDELITGGTGLASIQLTDGVYVTDSVTIEQIAEFTGMPKLILQLFWSSMNYGEDTVPIPTLLRDLASHETYLNMLDADTKQLVLTANAAIPNLEGEHYSRIVFNMNGSSEGKAEFQLVEDLRTELKEYYSEIYLLGDTVNYYDISESFFSDNLLISLLTVLFVLLILAVTFRSYSIPFLLVLMIQGAIWINMSVSVLMHMPLLFMSYLIVTAIQMGATIDYAILITTRFNELKRTTEPKQAMINALIAAFPTVITSGSILTIAGFLVGGISTSPYIFSIGSLLGRGTLISVLMVLTLLPQILLISDKIVEKTYFRRRKKALPVANTTEDPEENKPE